MGYSETDFVNYINSESFKKYLKPILQDKDVQDDISAEEFYEGYKRIDAIDSLPYWKSDYKRAYIDMLFSMDMKTGSNMFGTFLNQCPSLEYSLTDYVYHVSDLVENITIDENSAVEKVTSRFLSAFKNLKSINIYNSKTIYAESDIDTNLAASISTIDLEKADNSWVYLLFKAKAPQEVSLPKKTEFIPDYCFAGNRKLDKIVIPQSCKKIGSNAFADCSNNIVISISRKSDIEVAEKDLNFIKSHTKWRA